MKELPRRVWHISAGLSFSVAGLLAPPGIFLPVLVAITIGALILDIVRLRSPWVNRHFMIVFGVLLRGTEVSTLTSSTYFLIAASIVFIFCDQAIAATALAFAAVGDPIAGMVRERWAKPRLISEEQNFSQAPKFPQNPKFWGTGGKSFVSSFACFMACLVVGVILATVTNVVLWVVVVGAICATVIESLSLRVNDNLSIPLAAAGGMSLVQAIVT